MPFPHVPPLFGWLQELGPLLVVVFWVLRQVLVAGKDDGPARRPQRAPLDDEPAAAGGARGQAAKGQDGLRTEVDDFLRRVERMRGGEPAEEDEPPKRRPSLDPFEEPVRRRPRRQAHPIPQPAESIELLVDPSGAADEPTPAVPEASRDRPVADRSVGQLRESQLAENAAHLGEGIASAGDRVEARLHEKFDHRLGSLRRRAVETPNVAESEPPTSTAARVRKMLSEPTGARDAFVLAQVFSRRGDP
ncbi:MAG: hypothetical protein AAF805_13265 [Planctomycetota bacterium]